MYCIHWQKADNISILLQTLHFRERHRFLRTSRLPIGQQPNVGHDVVLERVRRRADVAATTVSTETTRDFANENVLERGRQLPERIFVLVNEVQSRFVLAANDLVPDDDLVPHALGVQILSLDVQEQLLRVPVEQRRQVWRTQGRRSVSC